MKKESHSIGVSEFTVWKVTEDSADTFQTEAAKKFLNKLINVGYTAANVEGELNADNQVVDSISLNTGGELSINLADLTPEESQYLLNSRSTTDGITVDNVNDQRDYFVVAFKIKKTKNVDRLVKYAKVMFTMPDETAQTVEKGSVNFQTPTITGAIVPIVTTVGGVKTGDYKFSIESDTEDYTPEIGEAWFTDALPGVTVTP